MYLRRNRRTLLVPVALTVASMLAVIACSDSGDSENGPSELVVSVWGGTTEEFLRDNVDPVFHETHPNVTVTYSIGGSSERYNKAKSRQSNPESDVIFLDAITMGMAADEGLVSAISRDQIEHSDGLLEGANTLPDYAVPAYILAYVLGYSPEFFAEHEPLPSSWADLWRPDVQEMTAVTAIGHSQTVPFVEQTQSVFDLSDLDATYAKLAELRPRVQTFFYTDWNALYNAGDVVFATDFDYYFNAMISDGSDIEYVIPEEGAFASPQMAGLVAGIGDERQALAYSYLNALLSDEVMGAMTTELQAMPPRSDIDVPDEQCQQLVVCYADESQLIWAEPERQAGELLTILQGMDENVAASWGEG